MKNSVMRILTIVVALAMVLGCVSGCASVNTKLSVSNVDLDGDYLTAEDYIAEIEANAPEYSDEDFETEVEEPSDDEGEEPSDDEGEEPSGDEGEEPSGDEGEGEEPSGDEGEEPSGDEENNEDLFQEEEKDYSDYLNIVSYNIKCAYCGKSWAGVIENIKSVDADIVGLQECDNDTKRSAATPGNYPNQVQQLAHDMGYEYWYFSKTIDINGGGEYGHGVMSRFPIKDSQTIFFKAQKDEIRNMERHVLDVDGTELIFYNCHLNGSFFDQFNEVVAAIEKDYAAGKYVLLTGDFNISYEKMSGWLDADNFLPLNGNDTFSFGLSCTKIDNIIISRNITEYYMDESTQVGVKYLDAEEEDSDHPMIYSHIKLPEK